MVICSMWDQHRPNYASVLLAMDYCSKIVQGYWLSRTFLALKRGGSWSCRPASNPDSHSFESHRFAWPFETCHWRVGTAMKMKNNQRVRKTDCRRRWDRRSRSWGCCRSRTSRHSCPRSSRTANSTRPGKMTTREDYPKARLVNHWDRTQDLFFFFSLVFNHEISGLEPRNLFLSSLEEGHIKSESARDHPTPKTTDRIPKYPRWIFMTKNDEKVP